ncbi:glycoside hydrolase family 128 protein, partial [Dissoconium aciculare CBS 342.82]|uniref:Glycoside hydrolase family 128 protein n=1 Tax=Dissoconium aciculare CBS 342.82 TaxID=1314786 RepID=A0A6J3M9W3_9PEZI
PPPSSNQTGALTPNGRKAGLSGYVSIQDTDAFADLAPHISWYSDYTANPPAALGVEGVGMLWGAPGSACVESSAKRLGGFTDMRVTRPAPKYMFGFYEPDCDCPSSSSMSVAAAAANWDALLAPLAAQGTVLGSPSMCKQRDEDFLTPFDAAVARSWDVTSIHVNAPSVEQARAVVDYYVRTYRKPVWVSEFACVRPRPTWQPCTDQGEIDAFIRGMVTYLEGNPDVVAYGPSNGEGLGTVWPLTKGGALTASGKTYLSAI